MTPNNILNMAMLKELDFISITDHNSAKQLHTIKELSESYDFIIIPGIEVSVTEGFDVLCYFQTFTEVHKLSDALEEHLGNTWINYTKEDQVITDIYDITMEEFDKPLHAKTVAYSTLYEMVHNLNGLVVLAHINRPSCTPLKTYQLNEISFDGIEVAPYNHEIFMEEHAELKNYTLFHNSDAHSLLQIHEKVYHLDLKERSIEAFFQYVRGEK
jgi:PHP family Zn ribbon phosphoesterase